jgi:hypothetical protein
VGGFEQAGVEDMPREKDGLNGFGLKSLELKFGLKLAKLRGFRANDGFAKDMVSEELVQRNATL